MFNCQGCDFLISKSKSYQIVAEMMKFASILLLGLTKWRSSNEDISKYRKELNHALDYFCDSFGHVGAGVGHFVHAGWVHSSPIGHCRGDASDQSGSGAKSLGAI